MKSRNERLSEHLLQTDDAILNTAYEIDDPEKLKAYKKTKSAPITLLPRRGVWMPIVAAAACVALTVGLWQGGVFDPHQLPVEGTVAGTTTTEVDAPTDTTVDTTTTTTAKPTTTEKPTTGSTAKPTTTTTTAKPTTTTTTAKPTTVKPTTKTEPTKTTEKPTTTAKPTTTTNTTTARPTTTATTTITTATEPYILVGGEDDYEYRKNDSDPSLKDRDISPALKSKMKEYRNVNAVYQVIIFSGFFAEDDDEFHKFVEADAEYQSLKKQYEEARKAYKEAVKRVYDCEYPDDDPRKDALRQEREDAEKKKNEISNEMSELHTELFEKFIDIVAEERISYAAKYSKTEPISGYGRFGNGYYMELTADAINELADRGGYSFILASEKADYSQPMDD